MNWHFRKRKTANKVPAAPREAIDTKGRRIFALREGKPLYAPAGHSLTLATNGSGKTTGMLMPSLFSQLASEDRPCVIVMDGKNGEIAAQTAPMIADMGIPVAVIDDLGVFPEGFPYRVMVNPISALMDAFNQSPMDVSFATENVNHALIMDPAGGPDRNQFFRDGPRALIEFALYTTALRTPHLAGPGAVWSLLANPDLLKQSAELEAETGDGMVQVLAKNVLAVMETEYFPMHRQAALTALRIFGMGSHLHTAGVGAEATHFDLIQQRAVIFMVGPQRYMTRLSSYFSLHLQSFLDALYRGAGPVTFLNDEFTNTPLKSFVDALTTIRGFGGEAHNIAQSRSEIEKKFGKLEAQTIEDNAVFKLWMGFSSYQEAELVSKAMGESLVVQHGLNVDHQNVAKMGSGLSFGRQRWMSPGELMSLPPDKIVWWAKGVGHRVDDRIRQNEMAPFCNQLAPNPIEGGVLPTNPKITLKLPEGDV